MSGVVLPVSSTSVAASWQFYDWRSIQQRSAPAVDGVATIDVGQLPDDELWLVDRGVAYAETLQENVAVRLYGDAPSPISLLDGSNSGRFDVTEYANGLLVRPGSSLVAQWTGLPDGVAAVLTLQVRVYRRT